MNQYRIDYFKQDSGRRYSLNRNKIATTKKNYLVGQF